MGTLLLATHSWYSQPLSVLVDLNCVDDERILSLKLAKKDEESDIVFNEASPLGSLGQLTLSSCYVIALDDQGIDVARSILTENKTVRLVILHCSAVDYIARALEQNVSLEMATGQWLDLAREQLATFRAFRPRVVLVDAYECLSRPSILIELADIAAGALADYEAPKRPNAVAVWLASQCVASDAILGDWVDQVEACSTPVDGEPLAGAGFAEMLADWRAMVASRAEIDARARSIADEVLISQRRSEAENKQLNSNITELEHRAAIAREELKQQAECIAELGSQLKEARQQVLQQGNKAASIESELNVALNTVAANQKRVKELEDEAGLFWTQVLESQAILERLASEVNVNADNISFQTLPRNAPLRHGMTMDVVLKNTTCDLESILY